MTREVSRALSNLGRDTESGKVEEEKSERVQQSVNLKSNLLALNPTGFEEREEVLASSDIWFYYFHCQAAVYEHFEEG